MGTTPDRPHAAPATAVLASLSVRSAEGLSTAEAGRRLRQVGPNALRVAARPSFWRLLLRQSQSLLIVILLVAAAASFAIGDLLDGGVILLVVVINAIIGAAQEARAERALTALLAMTAPHARVLRDGEARDVPAADLVPGDVTLVRAGDLVPADGRLLDAVALQVDESALTGESAPVDKDAEALLPDNASLPSRANMLFAGSAITYGHGRLVVTATGQRSELGGLADAASAAKPQPTPLARQVAWLGKVLSALALAASAAVFALGLLRGQPLQEMFLVGLTLAVAAVPEGLPAVVTITLAIGVQRMATRRAIVRRLSAVEALGATTTVCSDKTGTLTRGEMRVVAILLHGRVRRIDPAEPPAAGWRAGGDPPGLERLARAAILANNAALEPAPIGDPTERALLWLAADLGVDRAREVAARPRLGELPFSSERKRMATLHRQGDGGVVYVKGAPDRVLASCDQVLDEQGPRRLDAEERVRLLAQAEELAVDGLRLLAIAERTVDREPLPRDGSTTASLELAALADRHLTLLGIVGLLDPPRPEVHAALAACRRAGIRVVMITGDHPATAGAIARQLAIADGATLTGADLETLDDGALGRAVATTAIFARVAPRQKMRIVAAFQRKGDVVAMTGDGANDAPSLRLADIGIAMGIRGTAVAKEAADMVLADDNFATIASAVEEGRTIYANLRKTVLYLLSGNLGEIMVLFAAMLLGLPLPLLPIQILWINLFTDALPAIGLGREPRERDVMAAPPRAAGESFLPRWTVPLIVVPSLLLALATLVAFTSALARRPDDLAAAQSAAFVTLVLAHLGIAWAQRSTLASSLRLPPASNPTLLLAVFSALALLLLMLYTPPGRLVAQTHPLDPAAWLITALLLPLPLLGAELVKLSLHAVGSADHTRPIMGP
ncbi:MAG: cation-translocating P-type ATPase [Chloroflexi bacterium]|nr:cation-translocating P-type ATPase [Chloroflexota bacterium]